MTPYGRALRASPIAAMVALALGALVVVAASGGGYFAGDWYPAALYTLVLAAMAFVWVPAGRRAARPVAIACAALAAYAGWSYLSIAWAEQKGDAWDGANRASLYALLFAVCALWPLRGRAALVLVAGFAAAVGGLAIVELVRVAWAAHPTGFFIDGRLATPVAYPSGDAALWSMAFFPSVVLASRRELAPELRGIFAALGVVLGSMALMGQSRGWLFALPFVVVAFLVLTPRRVRTAVGLLVVLAGIGLTVPAVLDVYDKRGQALSNAIDGTANWIFGAAAAAGVVTALVGIADWRWRPSRFTVRRAGAAMVAAALVALVAGAAVYVAERSPAHDVSHAWKDFKTKGNPRGGPGAASRLGRLGSNRYDFWRVSLDRFAGAPVGGIGTDNFRDAYLRDARSSEQPRYPHSLELRALSQTGIVGAALLAVAIVAALMAALRAVRRRVGAGSAAAAAGLGAFVYWLVHGSVDWFWELPALGGAAWALIGIAAGLGPRGGGYRRGPLAPARRRPALIVATVLLAASFGAPALAERFVNRATAVYPHHPRQAFDRLDTAAGLNPLSARPKVIAGRVALALGRPAAAARYFREAIDREPRDPYSHLQLGAILFDGGRRAAGLRTLQRAVRLEPRVRVAREALARARQGRRVDVDKINRALLAQGKELVR
ncbi:MAG: O-antigen ligase family protein [Thermoleophilaceae bacterium]